MSAPDPILGPPASVGSIVSFRQRGVQPPGALYLTVLDQLQLRMICSLASGTLTLTIKQLLTTGEIQQRQETITFPAATRTIQVQQFQLAEGFLLSVDCVASAGVARGQCYATGQLVRTSSATLFSVLQPLFEGYLQTENPIGWPLSAWENGLSGYGFASAVSFANPAAGAEILLTVPVNAVWEVHSLFYQLVTSAAAANRQSRIVMDGGAPTSIFFQNDALGNQAASLTNSYTFGEGVQRQILNVDTWEMSLPVAVRMRGGARIRTVTPGIQAADQYQSITAWVEEWLSA